MGPGNRRRSWCSSAPRLRSLVVGNAELGAERLGTTDSGAGTTGHSNGGIMAYRLACELSSRVVGVGVQSAVLGVDQCAPTAPVSLIHIHGTGDRNVPINGGVGDKGISGMDFPPAVSGVRTLAAADGCPADPSSSPMPGNNQVTITGWAPCGQGSAIEFLAVAGASHAWMGHAGGAPRLTGEPYGGLDSSATIWLFLIAHPRP